MSVTATATIGPSVKMLAVQFWDGNGAPTFLKTKGSIEPTLSINGGPPVTLTNAMWGSDSTHSPPTPYLPWVLYPVAGMIPVGVGLLAYTIPAGTTLTLTIPDGWATTVAGPVAGTTLTVTSLAGGTFLPPFDASAKSMRIGTDLHRPANSQLTNFHANIVGQSGGFANPDASGNPTGPFPVTTGLVIDGPTDPTDPLNAANARSGTWTLIWDGDHAANLTLDPGFATTCTLLSDVVGASNVGHTRTYQVSVNGALRHAPRINMTYHAAGATNPRVYPPGEPTDGSERFGANLKRMLAGYQCIRFLDSLWTNHSSVVDFSDFASPNQLSFAASLEHPGGVVTSLSPYTEPDGTFIFRPDWCSFVVTFAAPHGARTGQVLTFAGPIFGPNGNGTFPTTGGGVTQSLYNGFGLIRVLDDLRVATHHFPTGAGGTITDTYAQPSTVTFSATIQRGVPPAHCAQLASEVGADTWVNVPHAATDACVTALAQAILANLAAGRKCYVEYTNEHWNIGLGFEQNDYLDIVGRSLPGSGATATATVVNGAVTRLTLGNAGSGYVLAPTVTIAPPTSGGTAKAHATLINGTLALVLDSPGNGYSAASPPAVTITAGVGATGAYVWRAAQVHALFLAAFTAAGRAADLVRVMGGQYEATNPTINIVNNASRNGIPFDALAVAPYYDNKFGIVVEPNMTASFDTLDVDQLHDFSQLALQYGPFLGFFAQHRALLDAGGFTATQIVCYEGGPQNGTPVGVNDLPHRSRAWARHPRMRDLFLYLLQRIQDGGCSLYVDYVLFLLGTNNANWGKYLACDQLAGMGNGSDGLFDNRTNYFDSSQVVSVMGSALKTFAALAGSGAITNGRPRTAPRGPVRRAAPALAAPVSTSTRPRGLPRRR